MKIFFNDKEKHTCNRWHECSPLYRRKYCVDCGHVKVLEKPITDIYRLKTRFTQSYKDESLYRCTCGTRLSS
ncbi:MAG: hypothetical protein ACTSPN_16520 [Promethearchaeota archaeon]